MSFWKSIDRPFQCLAPMEEATDTVFREIVMSQATRGNLHVVYTEFVNTDGLCHPIGREKVIHRLRVNDSERALLKEKGIKLVAQIWGAKPDKYYEAVKFMCSEMEFDGIDINMGCPVPKIVKNGSCSKLITNPALATEIVAATKEASDLPVSVKTRIGFKEVVTESWVTHLLEQDIAALLIHGRIQAVMSDGTADWGEIARAVVIRDKMGIDTPIVGNGDVVSVDDSYQKCANYGVDGTMVGRGIFHNPWMFSPECAEPDIHDKLDLLWRHTLLFDKTWAGTKSFHELKRFYKVYASRFDGAAALRAELLESRDIAHVRTILDQFLRSLGSYTVHG